MSLKTPNCIFVNIENFSDTEYIDNIDSQLQNLPKEIYISKLLELFSANESKALWYRSVLYSRDKNFPDSPPGRLINRKTTKSNSSTEIYARYSHTLYMFTY